MKKGPNSASDSALMGRVWGETVGYRWHILGVVLLGLLATPLALLGPIPLKIAVDNVIDSKPLPPPLAAVLPASVESSPQAILVFAAALLVAINVLNHLQSALHGISDIYTQERMSLRFRAKLLAHAQRLSFAFHDRRGTADSIYRIQYDAPAVQAIVLSGIVPIALAVFTLAAMIYVVVRINATLALIALAVAPFIFLSAYLFKVRMRPKYKEAKRLESGASKVVQEILTSVRVVMAFGREAHEQVRFTDQSMLGLRARIRLTTAESVYGGIVSLATALGTAAVLVVGVQDVQSGEITLGELLVVIGYLSQLYGPLKTISGGVVSLQRKMASAERAFELLDEVPDVRERPDALPINRARGELQFKDVTFGYEPGAPVLQKVSFAVAPGFRLGIVGRTGAGKTTLVSLLTRFYDPDSGCVLLDGRDLRDYRLADLRAQFSIVLQDPVLFSTTIAQNIAYARPDASEEDIHNAAQAADALGFIEALPEGFDTVVGERGMRLSGGERQRISLARAFLKDAPILVLDEPTSSVDNATEASIMESMERLMVGRTTLMIAHRLTTLDSCDGILEIDQGHASLDLREGTSTPRAARGGVAHA